MVGAKGGGRGGADAGAAGVAGGGVDPGPLRQLVKDCLAKHLYDGAAFFADKLVTLSGGAPADVYLLAQAHFVGRKPRRALQLLRTAGVDGGLTKDDPRFRYLAAKCLAECGEWEECLATLGEGDHSAGPEEDEVLGGGEAGGREGLPYEAPGLEIRTGAAIALLRGRAFEALDDRARAAEWYQKALSADPYCYEAFEALVAGNMLTSEEEERLVAGLPLGEEAGWLRLLYGCKAKKYGKLASLGPQLAALEAAPPVLGEHAMGRTEAAGKGKGRGGKKKAPPPAAGWGLKGNHDVVIARAEWHYQRGEFGQSHECTAAVLRADPFHLACLPVHLASSVELRKQNDLFLLAHQVSEQYPHLAVAWYAVGCYYFCIRQYDNARRYFSKATALDKNYAPAWIGFGHAFAAQDESDQAMAAYRTANRLFTGCHAPVLCIGIEYMRTNNLPLAEEFFRKALEICPEDPLVHNELGVLAYRQGQFPRAEQHLQQAIDLLPQPLSPSWAGTVVNIGHAARKQKKFAAALEAYNAALALAPRSPSVYAAIGFTHHLQGEYGLAIDMYHKALSLRADDPFASDLLYTALRQESQTDLLLA